MSIYKSLHHTQDISGTVQKKKNLHIPHYYKALSDTLYTQKSSFYSTTVKQRVACPCTTRLPRQLVGWLVARCYDIPEIDTKLVPWLGAWLTRDTFPTATCSFPVRSDCVGLSSVVFSFTLFYFVLLCSTLFYFVLLCSTLFYFVLLCSTSARALP